MSSVAAFHETISSTIPLVNEAFDWDVQERKLGVVGFKAEETFQFPSAQVLRREADLDLVTVPERGRGR